MVVGGEISLNCYNSRNICHSHNMTFFFYIFYSGNDQNTYPSQCAKFGKKMCKECKIALDDRFYGRLALA